MAAPIFTNLDGDIVSFLKGQGAISLDAAGTGVNHQGLTPLIVGLTDSDSTDFDGGVLTVSVTGNAVASEDLLSLASSVTIPGSTPTTITIALSGNTANSTISVDGTVIGTLANDIGAGNDLVVNLNSNANAANVQTLVGALQYENTNAGDLSTNNRTVSINLTDGDGDTSATQDITVNITTPAPAEFSNSGQSLGSSFSYGMTLGDVDGDGDLDMVFVTNGANTVWLNDGFGDFGTAPTQSLGSSDSHGVTLGDVDGDGDLDMVVANNSNSANKVWLNDGSGGFSDSGQSLGSESSSDVTLGDVDGDGDLDMVVSSILFQGTKVWLNNGSGNFGATPTQSLGGGHSDNVTLGDIDGDGDLDMVIANFNAANTVWLNNGSGGFSGSQSLGNVSSYEINFGDLDGDGDLDLVVANNGANTVWLNYGGGGFAQTTQSLGSAHSYGMTLGDLDGDGDLDVVFANQTAPNTVWLNDGSGSFTQTTQTLGSSTSWDVTLGDFDGDGDLDVVAANTGGNIIHLNNGLPTFTSAATFSIDENNAAVGTVTATDPEGDTITFTVTGGADFGYFTIDANTGDLAFLFPFDFEDPFPGADNVYNVEVTATDGDNGTAVQDITVTIGDVPEAPKFTSAATFSINENATAVGTVITTDPEGDTVTFSLTGGADQALFDIDTNTGEFGFISDPDFETPGDAGTDNVYDIEVTADDGNGGTTVQAIAITVGDAPEAPVFTSATAFSMDENTTAAATVVATDPEGDTVTFSLTGGADQALFAIDTNTGELTFLSAPDFDTPGDVGTDNVYDVEVTADDGNGGTTVQAIAITVDDVSVSSGGGSPTPTNQLILGTSSNDSLVGGEGNDTIAGFEGDDIILGGEGNDELRGGQGNDELYGSTGNDTIYSGQGDDTLQGGEGNDLVIATGGNNVLLGGKGDDVVIGSSGNDLIRGGNGTDTLTGGDGVDIFQFTTGQSEVTEMGADQITDFVGGVDQIDTPGVAGTADNFFDLGSQSSFDSALAAATTAISTATGVIYVETEIGGVHYLFSDDDGDGTIDMAIQVGNDFGFADIV